jgi:hypothetical protein
VGVERSCARLRLHVSGADFCYPPWLHSGPAHFPYRVAGAISSEQHAVQIDRRAGMNMMMSCKFRPALACRCVVRADLG